MEQAALLKREFDISYCSYGKVFIFEIEMNLKWMHFVYVDCIYFGILYNSTVSKEAEKF